MIEVAAVRIKLAQQLGSTRRGHRGLATDGRKPLAGIGICDKDHGSVRRNKGLPRPSIWEMSVKLNRFRMKVGSGCGAVFALLMFGTLAAPVWAGARVQRGGAGNCRVVLPLTRMSPAASGWRANGGGLS